MKRLYLGIGLLVGLLLMGFWISNSMDNLHAPIAEALEKAAQQSMDGDMSGGVTLAQQAKQHWEKNWHRTASVADHSHMDEIDGLFAQMEVYSQTGQTVEFASYCARLAKLVEAVGEAHSLTWWNLM